MAEYLLADVGSTFTKLCVVDAAVPAVRAQAAARTTVESDVNLGFDEALARAGLTPDRAPPALVCSSAAGGLRLVAIGLVPELTLEAARLAALGAGAKVIRAYSYRLTRADLDEIAALNPDLLLLAGGTDGGDEAHLLENAARLRDALPPIPLIVAGNRAAEDAARALLAGRPDVHFAPNVMPRLRELRLEPAREVIRDVFLRRIVHARGLDRLHARAQVLMPTPEAVLRAVTLLARGPRGRGGWGDVLAVDIGGATTDVYSCSAGLPEDSRTVVRGLPRPYIERTVEGDIGLRHTLPFLLERVDASRLAAEAGLAPGDVEAWTAAARRDLGLLPRTDAERAADAALARAGIGLAVARHAGRVEETFTPEGRVRLQDGKDLGAVGRVIGSGGPFGAGADAAALLSGAVRQAGEAALKPRSPSLYADRDYLLWALGLLADREPEAAFVLMERHLKPVASPGSLP